jgi:Dyp-type peroxidase family
MIEEVLESDEIQGNILQGFNKPYQSLAAFTITDVALFRRWLSGFLPSITSLTQVVHHVQLRKALLRTLAATPPVTGTVWQNIVFTASGLAKLNQDQLPDSSFNVGMAAASRSLGDWTTTIDPGHPDKWIIGKPNQLLDLMIVVAGDIENVVQQASTDLLSQNSTGIKLIWSGDGLKLGPGREHFGFNDGISQPGVRGTLSAIPGRFVTERSIDPSDPNNQDPNGPEYSTPGQPLVWPGQFVIGYHRQNSNDYRVPNEQPPPPFPAWARNGSFLVFRRLEQHVGEFLEFIETQLPNLQRVPGFQWLTSDALAAILVGRWQHGTPLLRSPHSDPGPTAGEDPRLNNAFSYRNQFPDTKLLEGFVVPGSPNDPFGTLCPFSAHIRKVNPRDTPPDFNSAADTLTHRILRRGIPYGPAYTNPDPANGDRGLFFLSFQTDIAKQFEFLQSQWMDSAVRPFGSTGHDLLVGQSLNSASRSRSIVLNPTIGTQVVLTALKDFVTVTGGGYFFAPSLSALRQFAT